MFYNDNIKKYKNKIEKICNIQGKDINKLSNDMKDAVYGVIIIMSIMDGVNSDLKELSRYTGISFKALKEPYLRLRDNGIFTYKYDLSNNKVLRNQWSPEGTLYSSKEHAYIIHWGTLAGIAGGHYGMRNDKDIKKVQS